MIALDIETELNDQGMYTRNLTVASIVDIASGAIRQFSPDTVTELVYMLPYIGWIVTFNGDSFDLSVLSQYAPRPLKDTCQSFDMYRDLARRSAQKKIKMDDLSLGTLGHALPQHGENLAALGQTKKLWQRSANGTVELAEVYKFGVLNRYVTINRKTVLQDIAVDWIERP